MIVLAFYLHGSRTPSRRVGPFHRSPFTGRPVRRRKALATVEDRIEKMEHKQHLLEKRRQEAKTRSIAKDDESDDNDEGDGTCSAKHQIAVSNNNSHHHTTIDLTTPTNTSTGSIHIGTKTKKPHDEENYGLSSDEEVESPTQHMYGEGSHHSPNLTQLENLGNIGPVDPQIYQQLVQGRIAQNRLRQAQQYHGEDVEARALHELQQQPHFMKQSEYSSVSNIKRYIEILVDTEIEVVDGSEETKKQTVRLNMRLDENFDTLNKRLIEFLANQDEATAKGQFKHAKATFKQGLQTLQSTKTLDWYHLHGPNVSIQAKIIVASGTAANKRKGSSVVQQNWGKSLSLVLRLNSTGQKQTVQHGEKQPFQCLLDTARQILNTTNNSNCQQRNKKKVPVASGLHLDFDGERLNLKKTPVDYGMDLRCFFNPSFRLCVLFSWFCSSRPTLLFPFFRRYGR